MVPGASSPIWCRQWAASAKIGSSVVMIGLPAPSTNRSAALEDSGVELIGQHDDVGRNEQCVCDGVVEEVGDEHDVLAEAEPLDLVLAFDQVGGRNRVRVQRADGQRRTSGTSRPENVDCGDELLQALVGQEEAECRDDRAVDRDADGSAHFVAGWTEVDRRSLGHDSHVVDQAMAGQHLGIGILVHDQLAGARQGLRDRAEADELSVDASIPSGVERDDDRHDRRQLVEQSPEMAELEEAKVEMDVDHIEVVGEQCFLQLAKVRVPAVRPAAKHARARDLGRSFRHHGRRTRTAQLGLANHQPAAGSTPRCRTSSSTW